MDKVKLGTTDLGALGLRIEKASGFHDFPGIKNPGNNWPGANYTEALVRDKDYQYGTRTISLDCFAYASTWAALNTILSNVSTALKFDGVKMLFVEHYSYRGYMVRLAHTTIYAPYFCMIDGVNAAKFRIVFEEPQPFNFQLVFYEEQIEDPGTLNLNLVISKTSKGLSLSSDSQQFVVVHTPSGSVSVNLEQEDYDETLTLTEGEFMQIVVTGEIDAIEDIGVTAAVEPREIADYFLRNGSVTYYLPV